MKYPTMDEVNAADHVSLARWYRFLVSPGNSTQGAIMRQITHLLVKAGGITTAVSKEVGLDRPCS